jgi:MFS family permease
MGLVAMRIGPFSALLTALVPDDRRGSLLSLTVALGQVGFAVGGTLSGLLYAARGFGPTSVLAAISVLGMGLVVWTLVPEPGRELPTDGALGRHPGPGRHPGHPAPPGRTLGPPHHGSQPSRS